MSTNWEPKEKRFVPHSAAENQQEQENPKDRGSTNLAG